MKNPYRPDLANQPFKLGGSIPVAPSETLYLYARLAVLDPSDAWLAGNQPDSGVSETIVQIGNNLNNAGQVISVIPVVGQVGAVISAFGAALTIVGEMLTVTGPTVVGGNCGTARSLVPGFGANQPPSDMGSPVLRVPLNGRDLWNQTSRGDAVMEYNLDYNARASGSLCMRPHTKIQFRVRRIVDVGVPGAAPISYGGVIVAPEPNVLDAVEVSNTQPDARRLRSQLGLSAGVAPQQCAALGSGGRRRARSAL